MADRSRTLKSLEQFRALGIGHCVMRTIGERFGLAT
jgi:hypothetical protein